MIYIGQTRKTVAERVKQHIYQQSKIGKAMTKYGTENFSIDVIDHADTQEELDSLERFWIAFYNSCENGYNTLIGGQPTKKEFQMLSHIGNSIPRKKKNTKPIRQKAIEPKTKSACKTKEDVLQDKVKMEVVKQFIECFGDKDFPIKDYKQISQKQLNLMRQSIRNYQKIYMV